MHHLARATAALTFSLAACADDVPTHLSRPTATPARLGEVFPDVIPLPTGFSPEGIAFGRGTTFFVGSIYSGAIFRGDARTGTGALLAPGVSGREHAGITYDRGRDRLIVAGGMTGKAYIYDASTGATLAVYELSDPAAGPTLVNDVALTSDAAYFTDSFRPAIYRLPLPPNGALPALGSAQTIPLTGTYEFDPAALVAGNANGIVVTPDEKHLILVNTTTGKLSRVDARTGRAHEIDLAGGSAEGGDGILFIGHTLYVVQGHLDRVAVIRLSPRYTSGVIERVISSAQFRFPSTAAVFGNSLYVVNARFDAAGYPDVSFDVVRVPW